MQQRERNKAIGIKNDTQFLRGMVSFARNTNEAQLKNTASRMVEAAYLKAMIDQHKELSERLAEHILANIEDADTRNEGVFVMRNIEAYVTHLGEKLEELWQH